MSDMIVVYIACNRLEEARKIGKHLMRLRVCPCYNIIPQMQSAAFWPPGSGKIEEVDGAILLVKTLTKKFPAIEKEVLKMHSDKTPCIYSMPVLNVYGKYYRWLKSEIKKPQHPHNL
jgi:uncharacterized protein involved in tolerance to divalent cations